VVGGDVRPGAALAEAVVSRIGRQPYIAAVGTDAGQADIGGEEPVGCVNALGSSLVPVKHSAKEVGSAYPGSSSLPNQGQTGGRAGRFQPKRSVWTVLVEVLDVDPEDLLQVPAAEDQQPRTSSQSRHSARMLRTHRSA
jgi:hypothetical protein